ncbi:MAG: hypothetical protein ACLQMF_15385 [Rectinemataceae bacterium]
MARAMRAAGLRRLCCLGFAAAAGSWIALHADSGSGIAFGAAGTVATFAEAAYPETPAGAQANPAVAAACQSDLRLSARSQSLLFRLSLLGSAEGSSPSAIAPPDGSDALLIEVREAETTLLPSQSLALRGGMLLRNFGIGTYGSPANPFARDEEHDQGGFWGLDAEWTPGPAFSALAILSADRAARSGSFSGLQDFDSGALFRYTPGALDSAAGFYASGAGGGELRPVAYLSLSALNLLSSLEAAVSFPLNLPQTGPQAEEPATSESGVSESLRFELRKSVEIGQVSLELGAAYRGIYPGRSEEQMASLIAETRAAGLPVDPFAPFYGRHYAEFSAYAEETDAFSLSSSVDIALPWGSLSADSRAELYIGDATLYVWVQNVAGTAQGEFNNLAPAELFQALDIRIGVKFSF